LHLNNHKEVFTYLSHEDLETKGVLHKDCAKFKILNYWHDTIYLDYFWLERRTGLIKWMRETARIDELVGKFAPSK